MIRIEWLINGFCGNGEWLPWSAQTEAALVAHVAEGRKQWGVGSHWIARS